MVDGGTARRSVEDTLRDHEARLRALPGVRSVGVSHEAGPGADPSIVVFVEPGAQPPVPATLDGWDVVVRPALAIG